MSVFLSPTTVKGPGAWESFSKHKRAISAAASLAGTLFGNMLDISSGVRESIVSANGVQNQNEERSQYQS